MIYENGSNSDSAETRSAVKIFKQEEGKNIRRINRQLKNGTFKFENNHARFIGKKKRPIVLSPIKTRIVQRALLDVLQALPSFKKYLEAKGSYGALKNRGVRSAIESATNAITQGADTFYKSDIKSFFTEIPIKSVIEKIAELINDDKFLNILENATILEIADINTLSKEKQKFFRFDVIGTPQGCCLSPLFANILLFEFDQMMNESGITCIRYLDDFLILGSGWKKVSVAFNTAKSILKKNGLTAYTIDDKSGKAKSGAITTHFDFLGVEFQGKKIKPNRESCNRILESIKFILKKPAIDNRKKSDEKCPPDSLISAFYKINNKLSGWANQYSFCNDDAIFGSIDIEIDKILHEYMSNYKKNMRKSDKDGKRRLLGIQPLSDRKKKPICF